MRAANDGAYDRTGPEPSCGVPMYSCCVCGARVAADEWSDGSTCCSVHLMPTERIEDTMYRLAQSADVAFRFRGEHR